MSVLIGQPIVCVMLLQKKEMPQKLLRYLLFLHFYINSSTLVKYIAFMELKHTMHCWKILNIQHHYGTTRIILMAVGIFLSVFSISYVMLNLTHDHQFTDRFFPLFIIAVLALYPIHKFMHFIALYDLRHHLTLRLRVQFFFIPVFHMRLREPIAKNRYIIALLTPFFILNTLILCGTLLLPAYTHYGTLLLAYHCGLCLIDILYVKYLWKSPKDAQIEETPKGYEILVPPTIS